MKNQLQVFENQEFGKIRVIEIDGQPWFIGNDICDVFGETHRNRAMQALDEDEKGYTQMDTPGGKQKYAIVNESGLYSLLFAMKPAKARGVSADYIAERAARLRDFRRWVTHDVLPSIRKHGAYMTDKLLDEVTRNQDAAQELFARLQSEKTKSAVLCEYVDELRPKALYHDTILKCTNAVQTSLIAKEYGMTAIAFNKLLHGLKIQFKMAGTWVLYKNYQDMGYTVTNTYYVGGRVANVYTLWTQRGRFFLYDFLRWHGILPIAEKVNALMGGDDNLCQ